MGKSYFKTMLSSGVNYFLRLVSKSKNSTFCAHRFFKIYPKIICIIGFDAGTNITMMYK